MTDITLEQRAAWLDVADGRLGHLLMPLLPSELTNPQPVLPIEPGTFRDSHGHIWELLAAGDWYRMGALHQYEISLVRNAAPFTRLVRERPQITKERLGWALDRNGMPIENDDPILEDILEDLLNGTDSD